MQVDLSEWTQLNGNVFMRVYACGTVGIVRASENKSAEWWADYFSVEGVFEDGGLEYVAGVLDEMKAALDKRFDPQPEMILGGEKIGCDWTVYVHNGRLACVDRLGPMWFFNRAGHLARQMPSRESAESAARSYVLASD